MLATGTQDGHLVIFDTRTFSEVHRETFDEGEGEGEGEGEDCVNSVHFHPYAALLACTGQRRFDTDSDDSDCDGNTQLERARPQCSAALVVQSQGGQEAGANQRFI